MSDFLNEVKDCMDEDPIPETDSRDFIKMIDRHGEEIRALNWDGDDDVLGCLSLDYDKLK